MGTLGLEAVFVGQVTDGVLDTIGAGVAEGTAGTQRFSFRATVVEFAFFLGVNSVFSFVSEEKKKSCLVVKMSVICSRGLN